MPFTSWLMVGSVSVAITAAAYIYRRDQRLEPKEWWDAEGLSVFMLTSIVLTLFALSH
jgi:hypothetical protein